MGELLLHANSFNGTIPPSLMQCSNLTALILRDNHFVGEISALNFSKLHKAQVIDLSSNRLLGNIPDSLCSCNSLTALRLSYPACMASLTSLAHLSLSNNSLSNVVGALNVLRHCDNLAILLLTNCFRDETKLDDDGLRGFKNLQILGLGGSKLNGQLPPWIAKLSKLKMLDLSNSNISGPIPTWIGSMPSLFALDLTTNFLSGGLPHEMGQMPALVADNTISDWSYLALPIMFKSREYNHLFNIRSGLKLGRNSLNGRIPQEMGRLKHLQVLDLSSNNFSGSIPEQLSGLTQLEKMDISGNHLSGEIPQSLTRLTFLSYLSLANNDLRGEIPSGGQFDTFSADSFAGNLKLCGHVVSRRCTIDGMAPNDEESCGISCYYLPFELGYSLGILSVAIALLLKSFQQD